jgi:hypothetical protein
MIFLFFFFIFSLSRFIYFNFTVTGIDFIAGEIGMTRAELEQVRKLCTPLV